MMEKNIWLIRHGESESNAGVKTEHPRTVALTDVGRTQAKCFADSIDEKPDLIVYSPYIRSLQTALLIQERFQGVTAEEWPVQEFTYLDTMDYYQTTRGERKPKMDEYWDRCDPSSQAGGGSESFDQFFVRVERLLEDLSHRQERILIFTHGHVIRMVMWRLLTWGSSRPDLYMKAYASLRHGIYIPNCAVLKFSFHNAELSMSQLLTDHLPVDLISSR